MHDRKYICTESSIELAITSYTHVTNVSAWGCTVSCMPNLNRHASMNLGRCTRAQADTHSTLGIHSFATSGHLDTDILQDKLACPGGPLVGPRST